MDPLRPTWQTCSTRRRSWLARLVVMGALAVAGVGLSGGPAAAAESSRPVASALWVEGRVTVAAQAGPHGTEARRARAPGPEAEAGVHATWLLDVLDPLSPGEHLELAAGARAWLLVGSRELWDVVGPGHYRVVEGGLVRVYEAPKAEGAAVAVAAPGRHILEGYASRPTGHELGWVVGEVPGDACLGSPLEARALWPSETAVRSREPLLEWEPGASVGSYAVGLWELGPEGELQERERWRRIAHTAVRLWQPLSRGRFYLWRVDVERRGVLSEIGTPTWIGVLSEEQEAEAKAALDRVARYREELPGAARAMDVLEALTLETHGLLTEAAMAWQGLAARRGNSDGGITLRRQRLERRVLVEPRELLKPTPRTGATAPVCAEPEDEWP